MRPFTRLHFRSLIHLSSSYYFQLGGNTRRDVAHENHEGVAIAMLRLEAFQSFFRANSSFSNTISNSIRLHSTHSSTTAFNSFIPVDTFKLHLSYLLYSLCPLSTLFRVELKPLLQDTKAVSSQLTILWPKRMDQPDCVKY
jgi:hypothetical protein